MSEKFEFVGRAAGGVAVKSAAWSPNGAIPSKKGDLLIANSDIGLLKIDEDGKLQALIPRRDTACGATIVSQVNGALIGGLATRSDGTLVTTDLHCGHVYGIQLSQ